MRSLHSELIYIFKKLLICNSNHLFILIFIIFLHESISQIFFSILKHKQISSNNYTEYTYINTFQQSSTYLFVLFKKIWYLSQCLFFYMILLIIVFFVSSYANQRTKVKNKFFTRFASKQNISTSFGVIHP